MSKSSGGLIVIIIGIGLAIAAFFMLKKYAEEKDPTVVKPPDSTTPGVVLEPVSKFEPTGPTITEKIVSQTAALASRNDVAARDACVAAGNKWLMDMNGVMYCQKISDADRAWELKFATSTPEQQMEMINSFSW